MMFTSPTRGEVDFDEMFAEIIRFMERSPDGRYRLIIGTDSQLRHDTTFVTAVIVHHEGKGARYFYARERRRRMDSLRQRILYEASLSLQLAGQLAERLSRNGHADLNVEIHLDIGRSGQTRELIREVVGMVTGSGFDAKIKPESYGASSVADKHTK
ncbi:MAG TPA: ribonuclease H-like YkuK family protein [Bacillota bacterium]